MSYATSTWTVFLTSAALLATPSAAYGCEIRRVLTGATQASTKVHRFQGSTYNSYPVRSLGRVGRGANTAPRYELEPKRWGFDITLPSGKVLATINREVVDDGGPGYTRWMVNPMEDFAAACGGQHFELRADGGSKAVVISNGRIGSIANFPFHEVF